jgi:hypothetical protein
VRYQHESVALCEGLQELGYEFFGADNYWFEPERQTYLIKKAPENFSSDVNIYSTFYFRAFPAEIENVDYRKINIFIDREDGLYGEWGNPKLKKFHLILRTHYNKNINYKYYNKNIYPWAFGLSNRIVNAIDSTNTNEIINRTYLSFRLSHDLRSRAVNEMSPSFEKKYPVFNSVTIDIENKKKKIFSALDEQYWIQSGHRHDPEYYKLLNTSLFTYAFGGFLYLKPFATNRIVRQLQHLTKLKKNIFGENPKNYFINQFDSWRLWESFYANSCPIHMDFDYWDWILPVMPQNKIHYWGVEGFDFKKSAEVLIQLNEKDILKITKAGKQWSLENYSSKAVAKRLIEMIN